MVLIANGNCRPGPPLAVAWSYLANPFVTAQQQYVGRPLRKQPVGYHARDLVYLGFDLHNYPEPAMPSPELFGKDQVIVLGEFGGLGLPLEGHTWQDKNNWGYQSFTTQAELLGKYEEFMYRLQPLIQKGLAAAIYTQTTDVEIETNGLMTYDRKVIKMPEERMKQMHQKLYDKELMK